MTCCHVFSSVALSFTAAPLPTSQGFHFRLVNHASPVVGIRRWRGTAAPERYNNLFCFRLESSWFFNGLFLAWSDVGEEMGNAIAENRMESKARGVQKTCLRSDPPLLWECPQKHQLMTWESRASQVCVHVGGWQGPSGTHLLSPRRRCSPFLLWEKEEHEVRGLHFQLPSPPPRRAAGIALSVMTAAEHGVPAAAVFCTWRYPTTQSSPENQSKAVVFCWWNSSRERGALKLLSCPGDLPGWKQALVRAGSSLLCCPSTLAYWLWASTLLGTPLDGWGAISELASWDLWLPLRPLCFIPETRISLYCRRRDALWKKASLCQMQGP